MQEGANEGGYTRKQILREEIEAPFRKVRLFLVPASFASAALAAFISATRLVATLSGVKGYDFNDTANNLGLDIVAMIGLGLIWKRDIDGRNRDLERIARSGRLADLQVDIRSESGTEATLPLKTFRKQRRIAIIVGGPDAVAAAGEMAAEGRAALTKAGAIVVPVVLPGIGPLSSDERADIRAAAGLPAAASPEDAAAAGGGLLPCLAAPVLPSAWVEWLAKEREQAEAQGLDLAKGFVIMVERSGFIKQRVSGVPTWQWLAGETEARNKPYGMPAFFGEEESSAPIEESTDDATKYKA